MRATGIIRRIDDLGRVVIPKEIRRTLRIREGDPLEIFVDREGEVILKKYSPINELSHFATEYAEALFDSLHFPVLICDRDVVVSLAGVSKNEFAEKNIGPLLEHTIEDRNPTMKTESSTIEIIVGLEKEVDSYVISPIVASGDPIGCVMMFTIGGDRVGEAEKKVVDTAASFLAKQME